MLIFKCDLCKSEHQLFQDREGGGMSSIHYLYVYKTDNGKIRHDIDNKYCHECQDKIDKAKEAASKKAEEEMMKTLLSV